ncbi:MAG: response regulator, partial [Proteobacteria bacterium]|nr:response regulator [Pseudomonadota bacterium]
KIKYAKILEKNLGMVDTVWMRKDGTLMDVHLQSAPLTPGDLSTGVTFTALDITDRKKAEEDKRKMELQIQHVQKLESLGVLAGGIAHDFNNILMTILGNADLAVSDLSPASPAYINLIEIEKASRRAADLCKQMLAYSGHGKFISQPLDLSTVISEMNHMLEVSISKHVVLKYQLTENLPAVLGDANQINQIIMNLVVNSSEAIEKNSGVVSISTGAMECDRKYLTETYLDDNLPEGIYCYIEIADTGCGMEKDIIAKFFDPFFSTKFAGRGLGMSAVLGIVRGHKGALKVYSEPRRGTTIKVLFPALEDSVPATKNNEDLEIVKWRGHGTVLLVDDEETIRTLGKKMLERIGFSVLVAKDGRDAVNVYKQFESEIDCVLTDLTMPHMDGEVAFRELRKINRNVRVILSSGYNEQDVTEKFIGKGLAGFIQKPYTLALLREAMQKIFQNQE